MGEWSWYGPFGVELSLWLNQLLGDRFVYATPLLGDVKSAVGIRLLLKRGVRVSSWPYGSHPDFPQPGPHSLCSNHSAVAFAGAVYGSRQRYLNALARIGVTVNRAQGLTQQAYSRFISTKGIALDFRGNDHPTYRLHEAFSLRSLVVTESRPFFWLTEPPVNGVHCLTFETEAELQERLELALGSASLGRELAHAGHDWWRIESSPHSLALHVSRLMDSREADLGQEEVDGLCGFWSVHSIRGRVGR